MPIPEYFPLSALETIIFLLVVTFSAAAVFLGWVWYFSLDRRTHVYDEKLRDAIRGESSFSGIREVAEYEFIATSDTRLSKFIGRAKKLIGRRSDDPHKIVPVDEDVILPRKIEFIRQRVQFMPGRNILGDALVGSLRNFYAYQLALSVESPDSPVLEHFQSELGEYEYSQKVNDLSDTAAYDEIALFQPDTDGSAKDPLNDVFLSLVNYAEDYCVGRASDVDSTRDEINRCREVLQLSLFLLWARKMMGIEVTPNMAEDDCLTEYRNDAREEDNWGYWMLPGSSCNQSEFERLRHLSWSIKALLEEHWEDENYSELYPYGDSIREMEFVESPFVIFHRDEQDIRGGGKSSSG